MAKRYTDTKKWSKKWFRELGSALRDVRQFILDECSHSGVWEIDLDTVKHFTGQRVSMTEVAKAFQGKLMMIGEDKVFIPAFIGFQYGPLSEDSRPHQSVIRELKKERLWDFYQSFIEDDPEALETLSKGLTNPYLGTKDKDKEQDKDQAKDKDPAFDFESIYQSYPRHEGKADGMKSLADQVRHAEALEDFKKAVFHYSALMERRQTEPKHIKQFSSFVGTKRSGFPWREYIERPKELDQVTANSNRTSPPSLDSEVGVLRKAISTFGSQRGDEALNWLGEVRWEWVKRLGGWSHVCSMPRDSFADARILKAIRESSEVSA